MHFETSIPVTGNAFFNRKQEIQDLNTFVNSLQKNSPLWYALIGQRKVGKTSILRQFARQLQKNIICVYLDCWNVRIEPITFFTKWVCEILNQYIIYLRLREGTTLLSIDPGEPPSIDTVAAVASSGFKSLIESLKLLEKLASRKIDPGIAQQIVDLPERIALFFSITIIFFYSFQYHANNKFCCCKMSRY